MAIVNGLVSKQPPIVRRRWQQIIAFFAALRSAKRDLIGISKADPDVSQVKADLTFFAAPPYFPRSGSCPLLCILVGQLVGQLVGRCILVGWEKGVNAATCRSLTRDLQQMVKRWFDCCRNHSTHSVCAAKLLMQAAKYFTIFTPVLNLSTQPSLCVRQQCKLLSTICSCIATKTV